MDDATAIEKCKAGETDAFRHVVERYQRQAVGHAISILLRPEDAQDAAQEAFIDAFRSLKDFDISRPFYPWFYVLLRNRCYKLASRRRKEIDIDDSEAVFIQQAGLPVEERIGLQTALVSLGKEAREILTLKYIDGLSYDELAEMLQVPKGTVMSRLFHARRRLQQRLMGHRISRG